jgi:hypothetical protein
MSENDISIVVQAIRDSLHATGHSWFEPVARVGKDRAFTCQIKEKVPVWNSSNWYFYYESGRGCWS